MHEFAKRAVAAWTKYVDDYIAMGWKPYLLSFMFEPLPGREDRKLQQMERLIENAYGIFVTRVVRNPASPTRRGTLPVWLCSPDLPVIKKHIKEKQSLRDLRPNDGLHFHAILLLPPWSRIDDVAAHFQHLRSTYLKVARLECVDVEPITETTMKVVDYTFKQNTKGRYDVGENFVLPRVRSELLV